MKTIKVSEATNMQLDWLVAKCEGHDVVVLTVAEQRARWLQDAETQEEREKLAAEYDKHLALHAKPLIRILSGGGYKRAPYHSEVKMSFGEGLPEFQYTTNPAQMWPIIERMAEEGFSLDEKPEMQAHARVGYNQMVGEYRFFGNGETMLIAAARCYVVSKLGETVEVPEEL